MKKIIAFVGVIVLTTSTWAGGPKTLLKDVIKKELQKADFLGDFDNSAELVVKFGIDKDGRIILQEINSDNDELTKKFSEFIKTIQLSSSDLKNEVYQMRFLFKKY